MWKSFTNGYWQTKWKSFTNGYDVNWISGFGLVCIGIYQHSPSIWLQRGQIVRWRKH